jgi:hypothetical protein
MNRLGCVYLLTNCVNGKRYVGITVNTVEARWALHCSASRNGSKDAIHCAIRKYGPQSFSLTVLEFDLTWAQLCGRERHFIQFLGSSPPGGYNMSLGGEGAFGVVRGERHREAVGAATRDRFVKRPELREQYSERLRQKWQDPAWQQKISTAVSAARTGVRLSEARRQHMSQRMRGNKNLLGHVHTLETRAKISASGKSRHISDKARINMSVAKRGALNPRWGKPSSRRGVVLSTETKAKLSAARLGKTASCETRNKLRQRAGERERSGGRFV